MNKYQNQIKTPLLVDKAPGLLCQLSMIFFLSLRTFTYCVFVLVQEEDRKNNWLLGIIAVTRTCHLPTLQSYVNYYNLAFLFIGPTCSLKSEQRSGSFHLFPMPSLVGGLVDVMLYKGWEGAYYIYDSDEGQ